MTHLYRGEVHRMTQWREELADDYRNPKLKISYEEALAHHLRRISLPMVTIPGPVVAGVVDTLYAVALVVAFRPRDWKGHPELRSRDVSVAGKHPRTTVSYITSEGVKQDSPQVTIRGPSPS
jgi:uncharacterized membrane protein